MSSGKVIVIKAAELLRGNDMIVFTREAQHAIQNDGL